MTHIGACRAAVVVRRCMRGLGSVTPQPPAGRTLCRTRAVRHSLGGEWRTRAACAAHRQYSEYPIGGRKWPGVSTPSTPCAQHTNSIRCAQAQTNTNHCATERAAQGRHASPAHAPATTAGVSTPSTTAQRSARRRAGEHHRHATATTPGVSTPSTNARNGARGAGPTRITGMQPRPPPV